VTGKETNATFRIKTIKCIGMQVPLLSGRLERRGIEERLVDYLELEFVEDKVGSKEVTINYVVVSDGSLVFKTGRILNISPSLTLETVEWDFWVEFLSILEDSSFSSEGDELGVQ